MHLVIAPSPTAPSTPAPRPAATPAATVGTRTPSPIPVDVKSDPGPDGVEITGLIFAILGVVVGAAASGLSIWLAWRAVRIGRQANAAAVKAAQEAERANEEASKARAAVAAERRRTFELEVLRDLIYEIDGNYEVTQRIAENPPTISRFAGKLALLPLSELAVWREIWAVKPNGKTSVTEIVDRALFTESRTLDEIDEIGRKASLFAKVHRALILDVMDAISRRMDARDD